jgi:hypothetical protein
MIMNRGMKIDINNSDNKRLVQIKCEDIKSDRSYYIRNIFGKSIHSGKLINSNATCDMSELPKGPYFVEVDDESYPTVQKIVLE